MIVDARPKSKAKKSRKSTASSLKLKVLNGFPASVSTTLRYVDTAVLNPGTGVIAKHTFNASSVFAPNVTGTTHQPMGYDQWQARYKHFVVTGCRIKARYVPLSASPTGILPVIAAINLSSEDTFSITTASPALEQAGVSPNVAYCQSDNISKELSTLNHKFSAAKFFNQRNIVGNAAYAGDSATDPVEEAFFHLWCGSLDAAANPTNYTFLVTIDYDVVFTEPTELSAS